MTALNKLKSKNFESRKDYALEVKKYPQRIQPYLFINFDNEMSIDNFTSEWSPNKWLKYIGDELY